MSSPRARLRIVALLGVLGSGPITTWSAPAAAQEPVPFAPLLAPPEPAAAQPASPSSVTALIETLASGLEERARAEGVAGPVRMTLGTARGIDGRRAERVLVPRLRRRLRDKGVLLPSESAPVSVVIALSEERGRVWAIAVFDGAGLPGPSTLALSVPVDRELEEALGAAVRPQTNARFVLERLGLMKGALLDVVLVDADGDGVDEVAVLGTDGVRVLRVTGDRLERISGPHALPGARRWPRVLSGWMGRLEGGAIWIGTSAGHALLFDARQSRFGPAPAERVPLRFVSSSGGLLSAGWRFGSPVVTLPLSTLRGQALPVGGLPTRLRDLARLGTQADAWIVVDEDGALLGKVGAGASVSLASERVGDRIAVFDLDGDGASEVLTSSASGPGEPDQVVLRRVEPDLKSAPIVFRSALSGGAVVGAAVGRLDADDRLDVVIVEDVGEESVLWHLELAP